MYSQGASDACRCLGLDKLASTALQRIPKAPRSFLAFTPDELKHVGLRALGGGIGGAGAGALVSDDDSRLRGALLGSAIGGTATGLGSLLGKLVKKTNAHLASEPAIHELNLEHLRTPDAGFGRLSRFDLENEGARILAEEENHIYQGLKNPWLTAGQATVPGGLASAYVNAPGPEAKTAGIKNYREQEKKREERAEARSKSGLKAMLGLAGSWGVNAGSGKLMDAYANRQRSDTDIANAKAISEKLKENHIRNTGSYPTFSENPSIEHAFYDPVHNYVSYPPEHPELLAHELGHAHNSQFRINDRSVLKPTYSRRLLYHYAPLASRMGAGMYSTYKGFKDSEEDPSNVLAVSALANVPKLLEEGSASVRAMRLLREAGGKPRSALKSLLPAFGTYLGNAGVDTFANVLNYHNAHAAKDDYQRLTE